MGYTQPEPLRGKHEFGDFCCGDHELDDWLLRYSRHAEAARSARTFVTTTDGKIVIGFYSLVISQVEPDEATKRLLQGQPANQAIPVLLLARLAVDRDHQDKGVGRSLLLDALLGCSVIAERVGVAAVTAHSYVDASGFYDRFGFEESPTDPLHRILLMKDLRLLLDDLGIS